MNLRQSLLLDLGLKQTLKLQQALSSETGFIRTALIQCLEWLKIDHHHTQSIGYIVKTKTAKQYRDTMDFLLCEIIPNPHKAECFAYYFQNGKKLIELYTADEIRTYDEKLVKVLIRYFENGDWTLTGLKTATKEMEHI